MTIAQACEQIATIAADYRGDQLDMTPEHVTSWIGQFPEPSQLPILTELAHVLDKTYITRQNWLEFVQQLITAEKLAGGDARHFWRTVNFFNQQARGNSQKEMMGLFDEVLRRTLDISLDECGSEGGPWVYLDDVIFTGTHVRWDLIPWLKSDAPKACELHVVVIGMHPARLAYSERMLYTVARGAGKNLKIKWWRAISFEVGLGKDTEILQPRVLPSEEHVDELKKQLIGLGHPAALRTILTGPTNQVFSGEAGRAVLEHEFVIAGANIKYGLCPKLKENHWPLGYDVLKGIGFGALVVTFRNCANNCPLALWCTEPWYALFPRDTN